jgi:effector-binding domain-containing protein
MTVKPAIIDRAEQPYAAVRGTVTKDTFNQVADRFPEVFSWLAQRGIDPAGPPFFRYHLIGTAGQLEVEAGVPIATMVECTDGILCDRLPAGRYASITHIGHPDGLIPLTAELVGWASGHGLRAALRTTADGQTWGCRLEVLKTHPLEEPDPNLWETELVVLLAG